MTKNVCLKNVVINEDGYPQVEVYVEGERSYWLSPNGFFFQVSETAGDRGIGMKSILNVGAACWCKYILAKLAMSEVLDFYNCEKNDSYVSTEIFHYESPCRIEQWEEESGKVLDEFIDAVYNWLVSI